MEFRILGPLEVLEGDRKILLGGGRQRALLAVLLLHANEVVSSDRLIEELWGSSPPESARKLLQAHISQLRRTIDEGGTRLETRHPGYVLRVESGELDERRFELLVTEGEDALARGAADDATHKLREALSLWQGPPLSDFTYEVFAQTEIARLEESKLRAIEDLVDAQLALGRHGALVGELETHVDEHPLRERLRAQLMVALYRSDRQAEALQVYQEGRRVLVDELGIEPSENLQRLERAILTHDPALEAPLSVSAGDESVEHPAPPAKSRYGRRGLVLLSALGLAAAALAAALVASTRETTARPVVVPHSLVEVDPRTGKVLRVVKVGRVPTWVAAGNGTVWVVNYEDKTLSWVDARSGKVSTFGGVGKPTAVAVAVAVEGKRSALWVASRTGELRRLDPATLYVEKTIRLRRWPFIPALGAGSLWVTQPGEGAATHVAGRVARIDLSTGAPGVTVRVGRSPYGVSFGEGAAWVANYLDSSISRIDPRTNRTQRIPVGLEPVSTAVGYGSVWVVHNTSSGSVSRIDPATFQIQAVIPVGRYPFTAAVGDHAVWVTNGGDGTVSMIDPQTNTVTKTIPIGFTPHGAVFVDNALWVAVSTGQYPYP